ncbi:MAG TPA: PEP-CTERM sorting domain-containing protein [Phycisphaerales bacterium]|nr:PEP-CTERM sorting domain-containing protein [Phycisphaerales bacterium]
MMNRSIIQVFLAAAFLVVPSFAGVLLSPGDFIIAIDADGMVSDSSYPGAEGPINALDGDANTKYLNFGRENTGFIVVPDSAAQVQSFTITTANDWPARDPLGWELYGTNDAIASGDNSTGTAESWTLIGSGTVTLPDARFTTGPVVTVTNSTLYTSYKMLYPTLKDAAATNSMQIADVSFFESVDGSGSSILSVSNTILAIDTDVHADSRYPEGESPANLIDGTVNKYLNFGKENSGFIVTPSGGMTLVEAFQIMVANDAVGRDPASWELYGTNDAIASGDNSDGLAETWTLIDSGTLSLPDDRTTGPDHMVFGDMVSVDNDTFYTSYKMLFPTLKDAGANSMQIADIQFYGIPEPTTLGLLGLGAVALRRRRF